MDNLKKYNDYILEMSVIKIKEPLDNFTQKEIDILRYNEAYRFDVVLKNKAVSEVNKYKLSIYKRGEKDFLYRVRDVSKSFNSVILENKSTDLRDCLLDLDEYMWMKLREDKEREELAIRMAKKKEEDDEKRWGEPKNNDVFSGSSFSGKIKI